MSDFQRYVSLIADTGSSKGVQLDCDIVFDIIGAYDPVACLIWNEGVAVLEFETIAKREECRHGLKNQLHNICGVQCTLGFTDVDLAMLCAIQDGSSGTYDYKKFHEQEGAVHGAHFVHSTPSKVADTPIQELAQKLVGLNIDFEAMSGVVGMINHLVHQKYGKNPIVGAAPEPDTSAIHDTSQQMVKAMVESGMIKSSTPRVGFFSGEIPVKGDQLTFEQWEYEVRGYVEQDLYSRPVLKDAVLRSLRGPAKDSIRHLPSSASIGNVIDALQVKYGTVSSYDVLIQKLYCDSMQEEDTVSSFATRLESQVSRIEQKFPAAWTNAESKGKLRERFFHGLKSTISGRIRHKYDDANVSYFQLLTAARQAEDETSTKSKESKLKAKTAQSVVSSDFQVPAEQNTNFVKQLETSNKKLQSQIDELKKMIDDFHSGGFPGGFGGARGGYTRRGYGRGGPGSGRGRGDTNSNSAQNSSPGDASSQYSQYNAKKPECYYCGIVGHTYKNCRKLAHHLKSKGNKDGALPENV